MSKGVNVLIVEDEAIIAMDIQHCLEDFGYKVDEVASNVEEALYNVKKYKPNIVLMDIKLDGDVDGIEIVEEIQQKYKIPVLYLTSHTDEETLKRAQKTKPYGYIVKPVDENQLNSAIIMALSRFNEENKNKSGEVLHLGDSYTYDIKVKKLYCLGKEVEFTKKESQFIDFMIKNVDKPVNYDEVIKELWQNEHVPMSTLRSLVRRVRDRLEEDIIQTVSAKGYIVKLK